MNLQNKTILFIGTGFYDYELDIKRTFEKKGAAIFYFSTVTNSFIYKLCKKMRMKSLATYLLSASIKREIMKQPSEIDYIFIIKAENFTQDHIDVLKNKYKGKPVVLYFWDSLRRTPNSSLLLSNFKTILTFDRVDAEKYGLVFRPLFCREIELSSMVNDYTVSFVGGIHSIRYDIVKKVKKQLENKGLNYKFVLWISKWSYCWMRYITRTINKDDKDLFSTHPIPYSEYINISKRSKFILDISHPSQDGLTIRSIEAIGLGKRIITTNRDIVNYEFNKKMYSVIDKSDPVIDFDFINSDECPGYNVENYTIDSFVEEISKFFVQ